MYTYLLACIAILSIYQLLGKKRYNIFCVIASIIFGYLALHMLYTPESDLHRHISRIQWYKNMGFVQSLLFSLKQDNVLTHVSYSFATIFNNEQMYSACFVFFTYFLIFKLINNVCSDYKISKKIEFILILYILTNFNYFMLANSIRMWFVFAAFFYLLYEESCRNKKRVLCFVCYVLLVLFHYSALILLLVRLLSFIILKYRNAFNGIFFTILSIVVGGVGIYVLRKTNLGSLIENKIINYSNYSIRGTWQTISGWFKILIIVFPLIFNSRLRKKGLVIPNYILLSLLLINIIQYENYQMVLRFGDAFAIASPLVLVPYYVNKNKVFSLKRLDIYEFIFLIGAVCNFLLILIFCYNTSLFFSW